MAVLEKIRVKFGILITILVALALLSFIIDPQTLRSAADMISSDNQVGKMDGKSISYKDFYEKLDGYTKLAEITGQPTNDESAQASLREAAWQDFFDELVFIPRTEKAGVFVGDNEMLDLTQGDNISQVLLQQGTFAGQDGHFSREALVQFVQSLDADPSGNASIYWDFLESSVYKDALYSKYTSLIAASTTTNSIETHYILEEHNTTNDVDFILSPVSFAADSTIKVSAAEIRDYFNARKDNMKQPANRDIEYVMFEVTPSQADIDATEESFNSAFEEFKTADNLRNFITLNSDVKYDTYYYKESQLEQIPEFKAVFGKLGAMSDVHREDLSFSAAKVSDVKKLADSAEVFYSVVSLSEEAKADSIAESAAKAKSLPIGFQQLGWMTQEVNNSNGMSEFNVVLDGSKKVYKVKSTANQAWFVFYVNRTTKLVEKTQFATLVKNVLASDETYRDYLMKATELSDKADGKYEKFAQACKDGNYPVIPVQNIVESTRRIGAVENAREVVRWIFDNKTGKGDVSDVITVDNKYYFVAAVTKIRKEGKVDINDVSTEISNVLMNEKKVDKLCDDIRAKVEGCTSLEQMAEKLGTTVSHQSGVTFASANQQLDPKFIGAVASAEPGVITGPVAGQIGAFIFKVTDRQVGSFYNTVDLSNDMQTNNRYASQILTTVLAEEADVKDNRARFY